MISTAISASAVDQVADCTNITPSDSTMKAGIKIVAGTSLKVATVFFAVFETVIRTAVLIVAIPLYLIHNKTFTSLKEGTISGAQTITEATAAIATIQAPRAPKTDKPNEIFTRRILTKENTLFAAKIVALTAVCVAVLIILGEELKGGREGISGLVEEFKGGREGISGEKFIHGPEHFKRYLPERALVEKCGLFVGEGVGRKDYLKCCTKFHGINFSTEMPWRLETLRTAEKIFRCYDETFDDQKSLSVVKKILRKMSIQLHPDRGGCNEAFRISREASRVLEIGDIYTPF